MMNGSPASTMTGTMAVSASNRGAPTRTRARRKPSAWSASVSVRSTVAGSAMTVPASRRAATTCDRRSVTGIGAPSSMMSTRVVRVPGATSIVSVAIPSIASSRAITSARR
jgi:hypothetical protein